MVSKCLVPCRFAPKGLQCSCTVGTKYYSEYYTWFLFIFCYIVPLSLICFSYSQLPGVFRAVSAFREGQGGRDHKALGEREERVSALEHKTFGNVQSGRGVSKSSEGSGDREMMK